MGEFARLHGYSRSIQVPSSEGSHSMIIAINLALLPVGFVAVMVARELRPSRPDPEGEQHMSAFSHDVARAVEAYAAYLNALRGILDHEEQLLFDEDMARARAAMERAWLESTPVQPVVTGVAIAPERRWARLLLALAGLRRVARRAQARASA
jgi:hypothetical protein